MTGSAQSKHPANRSGGRTCHPELVEGSHVLSRALEILRLRFAPLRMTRVRLYQVFTGQKRKTTSAAMGFTLIEMLVVIAIIGVLAALLLPAISKVQKQAKRVKATAEVAQIAAAWNQYYSEYQHWPEVVDDEEPMKMVGELAAVLYSGAYDAEDNPRRMRFMDFKNYSSETNPITPWAEPGVLDPEDDPSDEDAEYFYWVQFDTDFNNRMDADSGSPAIGAPLTNDVRRAVIVWAANMDVAEDSSSYEPEEYDELYIIGSWE